MARWLTPVDWMTLGSDGYWHILRHLCFNALESDYEGIRCVADDAQNFFNSFEFIVAETVGAEPLRSTFLE